MRRKLENDKQEALAALESSMQEKFNIEAMQIERKLANSNSQIDRAVANAIKASELEWSAREAQLQRYIENLNVIIS